MRAVISPLLKALPLTLLLLITVRTAQAQAVTMNLSTLALGNLIPSTVINALPGDSIDFFGVLTNTLPADHSGANDLIMDSVGGNILGPSSDVTLDPTGFYDNFYLIDPVNPGQIQAQQILPGSGTAGIFTVAVAPMAVPGTYFGTFDIYDSGANIVGEAPFTIEVTGPTDTPEPSSGAFVLCGASALLLVARRKKRALHTV